MNSNTSAEVKEPSKPGQKLGRHINRTAAGMSRRSFLKSGVSAMALPMVSGCLGSSTGPGSSDGTSRLTAVPGTPTETPTLGLSELGLGGDRDGIMYVPENYSSDTAVPLFVGLHGASGDADNWNGSYPARAEELGMVFVAADSRDYTWDVILQRRTFGPDVEFLDEVLKYTFSRCRIDPTRIALGGFSDGASYAISLGIGNGDLFSHIIAYSPGFYVIPDPVVGTSPVFISHGTFDPVLSFRNARDNIAPALRDEGHDVTFWEFDGGHEVPAEASDAGLDWFLDIS